MAGGQGSDASARVVDHKRDVDLTTGVDCRLVRANRNGVGGASVIEFGSGGGPGVDDEIQETDWTVAWVEGGEWPSEENECLQGRRLGSGRASQAGEFPVAMDSGMPAGTKEGASAGRQNSAGNEWASRRELGRCTGGVRVIARTKLSKEVRINWYGRWVMVKFERMTGEVERVRW